MEIILYSTGCPKCQVLIKKLNQKQIQYKIENNTETMLAKGFTQVPMLQVDDNILNFKQATEWINKQ